MEPFELDADGGCARLKLVACLDMHLALPLAETLRQAAKAGGSVAIDASAVERISTACLQVLLAAAATFQQRGTEFSLLRPTELFVNAFADLGLFPTLMKWRIEA